jgi:hypothetical protein
MKNQSNPAIQMKVRTIPSATTATGNLALSDRRFFVGDMDQIAKGSLLYGCK